MSIDTSKIDLKKVEAAAASMSVGRSPTTETERGEDASKDAFFVQVAELAEAMIVRHGKEFAIGALVLAAKFIAEGRPLIKRDTENSGLVSAVKSG